MRMVALGRCLAQLDSREFCVLRTADLSMRTSIRSNDGRSYGALPSSYPFLSRVRCSQVVRPAVRAPSRQVPRH